MALPLTLIVITGEIDLSIASMLGLASTLLGYLVLHGWSILPAMLAVLRRRRRRRRAQRGARHMGRAAIDRGHDRHAHAVSRARRGRARRAVGGRLLAVAHEDRRAADPAHPAGVVGRVLPRAGGRCSASCSTPRRSGARSSPSGCKPRRRSSPGSGSSGSSSSCTCCRGSIAAFAGILWTFRFATSRYDAGTGLELTVVAIVLFGGVSIFGGRGSIIGVVLSAGDRRLPAAGDDAAQDRPAGAQHRHRRVAPAERRGAQPRRGRRPPPQPLAAPTRARAATAPARGMAVAAARRPVVRVLAAPPPTTPTTAPTTPTSSSTPTTASKG